MGKNQNGIQQCSSNIKEHKKYPGIFLIKIIYLATLGSLSRWSMILIAFPALAPSPLWVAPLRPQAT